MRGDFENDTDDIDDAAGDDCVAAAYHVGYVTCNKSTEEGSGRKDGDEERVVRTTESIVARVDKLNEVLGASDPIDVP